MMCEFCDVDVNKRVKNISDENDEMRLTSYNALEVAVDWEHGFKYGDFNINHCPMCGRSLHDGRS